jgi:esterase/lipase superfamily enzyme
MYVVSCRESFTSDRSVCDVNQVRNYTNPANHDVFQEMTMDELAERAANKHVCILVHGYRNPMQNVMDAYWQMTQKMADVGISGPNGYGLVIGFAWPGRTLKLGYFVAPVNARKAAPRLLELINALRGKAHSVDVQTHSLGARVALTALKDPNKVYVDNLLLSAPAVDRDLLEDGKDFHSSTKSCNRCFVYHSKYDKVLKLTYPLADVSGGLAKAIGLSGPRSKVRTEADTPNVHVVDCAARVKEHSGYRKADQYYEHWAHVLSGGPMSRYDELS